MAIVTENSKLHFGALGIRQLQILNNFSFNLTTTNGGIALPFIAEKTMTVTDIGAVVSSVGTTPNLALTIGIQTDSGSGVPSGTFLTTGSITLPANTWSTAAQFTVTSGTQTITTALDHYLKVGDVISFANTTGGVAINTKYWIASTPSANQMTLSINSTLTPVFTFSASVSLGGNTFTYSSMQYTHCNGISASITQNSRYWLVYQWSGTGTGQVFFNGGDVGNTTGQSVMYGLGYATRVGAVWAKTTTTRNIPVQYTDGTKWYGQPQQSAANPSSVTLNGFDRFGFRFSIPAGHPDILLDRIIVPCHPTSGTNLINWKSILYTDNGFGVDPTFVSDLSAITGDTIGQVSSPNFNSTIFQTNGTTWLSGGSSYIIMTGFDASPPGGPFVNVSNTQLIAGTRSNVVGPYNGGYITNWPTGGGPSGSWFTNNPEAYFPFTVVTGGMRYDNTGGAGGYSNASSGFANLGGN